MSNPNQINCDTYIVIPMASSLELKPYTSALYTIKAAPADGDCFYHAFIEQALKLNSETPNTPKRLRKALLEMPDLDPPTVDRLRENDWAQDQEIQAAAELTGLCIFVWSAPQGLWFYHYPARENTRWQVDHCEAPVYLINIGNPIEARDLAELHSSDATAGYHFDGLVPRKPFRELLLEPGEGDEGAAGEEDEELDILNDELMELLEDDEGSEDELPPNEEERDRYVAMSSMEKFKYMRKRLREYDTEKNAAKKYTVQRELLSFRGDMNLDRLEETPEHQLVLDSSPYAKESFALTNNQRFLKKLISPETRNRAVLLFHGVGVGKTCSAVQIATNFSGFYTNKALVILPSSLEGNFRKELFNVDKVDFERRTYESCYGNRYLERIPDWYTMSPVQLNKEVQSMINEQFEFMGFIRVVNAIMKIHIEANNNNWRKADAENEVATRVGGMFSHRVIVIDEVHNIRTSSDTGKEDRTKKQFPLALKKIIKHAVGIRLVLLSATPMFNDVQEIDWLTEIMFKCEQLPYEAAPVRFNTNDRLTSDSKNSLRYFARNYVSFMRGQDPSTFPDRLENEGDNILRVHPTKDITGLREIEPVRSFPLTASKLSGAQKRAYTEIIQSDAYGKHIKKLEQISNIAYPSSEEGQAMHGQEGFTAMFEESINAKKQVVLSYRDGSPKLTPNMLKKHACKMATILEHIREAEGIVMVFSFYIYSGLLPLAVALEHAGYVKYGGSLLKPPPSATRKGAYIILTAKEGYSPDNHKQLRELNAPENSDGDRIKVVLVGQVGSEGLDLQCVREVHIMEPWYHMNKIEQIIGRAVRFRSHERLPASKRNVTVYRHVAILEKAQAETLDYKNYRVSELKMRRIRQVEEILAQYALDCPLNLEENNRVRESKADIVDSRGRRRASDAVQDRRELVCARRVEVKRDASRLSPIVAADVIALAKQVIGYMEHHEAVYVSFEKRAEVPSLLEVPQFQGRERLLKGALNWIVRTRAPIIINDIRGRLLQLEEAYLFQPERLHDIKLTIRDRLAAPEQRVGTYVLSIPAASLKEEPLCTFDYDELLRKLELDLTQQRAILAPSLRNPRTLDEEVLLDMVVDRLGPEELRVLMANFGKKTDPAVKRSLKEGAVLIEGHPELYFDYHEGGLRRLDGTKATLLDNDIAMADHRQAVLKEVGRNAATGFLSKSKGRYEFKMTNPSKANKQVGTNCVATSTIKKKDLVTFTAAHITPNSAYVRLAKPGLCNVYEYALRTTNPKERHFLRPAQFEMLFGKN